MRRMICLILVLSMALMLLPMTGQAAGVVTGSRVTRSRDRAPEETGITLKEGHFERWIDRPEGLPEYALDFYSWLEDNAEGALADPTLATDFGGAYGYPVTTYSEAITVPCDYADMEQVADETAIAAMDAAFYEITEWAAVVYEAFDRDHPEVFWLNGEGMYGYGGSYNYSYRGGVLTVSVEMPVVFYLQGFGFDVRLGDYCSAETVYADIALRDETVAAILADCPQESLYEQLRYLNNTLTARNAYNSAVAEGYIYNAEDAAWECLNALVGTAGTEGPVCEGYARAFMVLCRSLEIPCVLVDGPARDTLYALPEAHMWNYVQLDGSWYAVDVTWNDPYDETQPLTVVTGLESEDWLLLGGDTEVAEGLTFLGSHPVENRVSDGGLEYSNGPVLSGTDFDPEAQPTGSLTVNVTAAGDETEELVFSLYLPGEEMPIARQSFPGRQAACSFEGLPQGDYILTLERAGHASRSYEVTVGSEPAVVDSKLCRFGDLTGDGRVNIMDVAKLYSQVKGLLTLDEYALQCADVSGDGRVNIMDVVKTYAFIKGIGTL